VTETPSQSVTRSKSAAEIIVEGRVQGVGYRNYAQRRGLSLGLAGYVMNLKDGRVRARAEGPRPVIEEFIRELGKGPPLSRVENVKVRWLPPSGRFGAFGIRYAEFES
jgi:acylphosphatase